MDLRDRESIKIQCGKKHFQAIDAEVCFDVTKTFRDFKGKHLEISKENIYSFCKNMI